MTFLLSPISLVLLIAATALFLLVIVPTFKKTREEAFREGD
jgi:putative tricarboxylic transport membrane protein